MKIRRKGKLGAQEIDAKFEFIQEKQLDFSITITNEQNLNDDDAFLQQR